MYRRRHLVAFVVLAALLYGTQSSVRWDSPTSCTITARAFSEALNTKTTQLRKYCEWLKRNHYLTSCDYGHGWIKVTLAPPVVRGVA